MQPFVPEAAAIRVSDAWVAPGANNAALYLTIDNDGGGDRLMSIDAKGLGPITLHQSSMDSGVMRMRALPGGIAVAAHGQTKLAPMGLHAMIEPLAHPLRPGDIHLSPTAHGIAATVIVVEPTGAETELLLRVGDTQVIAVIHGRTAARPDETVHLVIDADKAHVFDSASGHRLG